MHEGHETGEQQATNGAGGQAERMSPVLAGTEARVLEPVRQPQLPAPVVAAAVGRFRAEAYSAESAAWGVERMRFAFGVDHSLAGFHRAFKRDPLLGPMIRRAPWARPIRRPEPFEALAWAITEQLIETERAEDIQRRMVWRWGRKGDHGLRDAPTASALAARAPAELCALDLA